MMSKFKYIVSLVCLVSLAACGGSHGSVKPPDIPVVQPTPVVHTQAPLASVYKPEPLKTSSIGKYYSGSSAFAAMAPDCGSNVYNPDGSLKKGCFPCDAFLATEDFAAKPGMAVLWSTFGESLTCMDKFLKRYKPKPHLLEVHPFNNTCVRNGICTPDEIFFGYSINSLNAALERNDPATIEKIRHRIQTIRLALEALWNGNPNTYLILSTGLEDNYTQKAFIVLLGTIQKDWPYALLRSGSAIGSVPRETHGLDARCKSSVISVNIDGAMASTSQSASFLKNNKNCFNRQIWYPAHQGRNPNDNSIPAPPRERTFVWTAADVIREGKLLRDNQ